MTSRAPLNRTITLSKEDIERYKRDLIKINSPVNIEAILNKVINQNFWEVIDFLPPCFVDLLFVDPPYNLTKTFNTCSFTEMTTQEYMNWTESWLNKIIKLLKPTSSIYICGDWRSSSAIHLLCEKYFKVRNRITFEREKGRGANSNWKNNSEDIWFCTMSNEYYFNSEAVKLKRRVIAPYREKGRPKDWEEEKNGKYRLTYSSNIWTDITIPFWSMPENTPHPTQKPEKLLAKIILASSKEGDIVFDPFAGVGTTGVVAKKLRRNFVMIELDEEYCTYATKRLYLAENDNSIQGYYDGVFWERNSLTDVNRKNIKKERSKKENYEMFLFSERDS
ncbi:MAG TPA: site-specific DNA-methyltransferase [Candidatus Hydrogenedens sp.]|nr:site-specific DNA-methyltransferase [Candidatus Hydrogenedens sp.]HOK09917.1 site-specific DNA-methyltransferase [Candidatus Hydrogenedens sp.]HPP57705.1 site-specific DNA-methyltransferase [Candidatus Hydrogenedens sp.]